MQTFFTWLVRAGNVCNTWSVKLRETKVYRFDLGKREKCRSFVNDANYKM